MKDTAEPARLDQAEALAAALERKGFAVTLFTTGGHWQHPCLVIASGRYRRARWTEYVYAAPEADQWWFWWSSLERIGPITDVDSVAAKILFVLGLPRAS